MGTAVGSSPIPVADELAGGFRFWWPCPGPAPACVWRGHWHAHARRSEAPLVFNSFDVSGYEDRMSSTLPMGTDCQCPSLSESALLIYLLKNTGRSLQGRVRSHCTSS